MMKKETYSAHPYQKTTGVRPGYPGLLVCICRPQHKCRSCMRPLCLGPRAYIYGAIDAHMCKRLCVCVTMSGCVCTSSLHITWMRVGICTWYMHMCVCARMSCFGARASCFQRAKHAVSREQRAPKQTSSARRCPSPSLCATLSIYTHIHMCVHTLITHLCIHIYIERERYRLPMHVHTEISGLIYIYIYIHPSWGLVIL